MESNSDASRTDAEEPKSPSGEQPRPASAEEASASPSGQAPGSAEEPIVLKKLFPAAEKDLDALFPEQEMKKLLKDLVRTRQKNDRFLKRIDLDELPPEED
jgi:hypothetical protein